MVSNTRYWTESDITIAATLWIKLLYLRSLTYPALYIVVYAAMGEA